MADLDFSRAFSSSALRAFDLELAPVFLSLALALFLAFLLLRFQIEDVYTSTNIYSDGTGDTRIE